MRLLLIIALLAATAFANVCQPFTKEQTTADAWSNPEFYFGINDDPTNNGVSVCITYHVFEF
jgi:hypothetical protein